MLIQDEEITDWTMNTNRKDQQSHMVDEKKHFRNKNQCKKMQKTQEADTQLVFKNEWKCVFLKFEKKKLYMGFRATLNFRKFKVALNRL